MNRASIWPVKKQWLDWHSLLGIVTGLMLFIICWSGTFATISLELDWLFNSDVRSEAKHVTPQDLLAAYHKVQQDYPQVQIARVDLLASANYAISVTYKTEQGVIKHAFFDPASQQITGTSSFLTISRFFRDFHMYLFGFYGMGKYLVCIFAITLMASLTSILFFYKPSVKRFFERPATSSPRAFWGSWHRLSGLWSIWFLFIIGGTGIWYLFEQSRNDFIDGRFSYTDAFKSAAHQLPPASSGKSQPVEQLLVQAQQAMPELDIQEISFNRGGYMYITGQTEDSFLVRNRANKLYIEPATGKIAYMQKSGDLPLYWLWSNMADPLHFGNFAGWITKTLWVVFGLILSFLSLSGTWMYVKRLSKRPERINLRVLKTSVAGSLVIGGLTLVMGCIRISLILPVVEGQRTIDMPLPVIAFILTWILLTCAICIGWGRWLLKILRPIPPNLAHHL